MIKGPGQTADLYSKCCLFNTCDPLLDGYQTYYTMLTLERLSLLLFMSEGQGQTTGFYLTGNIVCSMFFESFPSWLPKPKWINYYTIATLLHIAPGWHLCFPIISCFITDDCVNQQYSCVHNEAYVELYFRRLVCVEK